MFFFYFLRNLNIFAFFFGYVPQLKSIFTST